MKKKGLSLVFVIPLMVASVLIALAFGYKLFSDETAASRAKASEAAKVLPTLQSSGDKPASGFGSMVGPTATLTPTPTPVATEVLTKPIDQVTVKDMDKAVSTATDDGGAAALNDLQSDINSL